MKEKGNFISSINIWIHIIKGQILLRLISKVKKEEIKKIKQGDRVIMLNWQKDSIQKKITGFCQIKRNQFIISLEINKIKAKLSISDLMFLVIAKRSKQKQSKEKLIIQKKFMITILLELISHKIYKVTSE